MAGESWKTKDEDKVKCPHCKEKINVKRQEKMITPAVPAEKEFRTVAEKDTQKTLDEDE